jgi:dTDP-4-dehydrorhamnose 3,5-epimerase
MQTDFAARRGTIDGLLIVTMKQISDQRGTVRELFRRSAFAALGVEFHVDQVNLTQTRRGAVRGMHAEAMTKLVTVAHGRAHGVYVDTRRDSPTFQVVEEVALDVGAQVLVPSGVANGFQALSGAAQYAYCFDKEWAPGMPGLAFNPLDPLVADRWPLAFDARKPAFLSVKDAQAPSFDQAVHQ